MEQRERYDAFTYATVGELAAATNGEIIVTDRTLAGYAVVWGAISSLRQDGKYHRFNRGSIKWASTVNALWAHDYTTPLASTQNGTLTITEDDVGARVFIQLDESIDADTLLIRIKNKLVKGMSFGGPLQTGIVKTIDQTDPRIVDVTGYISDEVTVCINPSMTETIIVAADDEKLLQERRTQLAKQRLANLRMTALKPGRVSGRAS